MDEYPRSREPLTNGDKFNQRLGISMNGQQDYKNRGQDYDKARDNTYTGYSYARLPYDDYGYHTAYGYQPYVAGHQRGFIG